MKVSSFTIYLSKQKLFQVKNIADWSGSRRLWKNYFFKCCYKKCDGLKVLFQKMWDLFFQKESVLNAFCCWEPCSKAILSNQLKWLFLWERMVFSLYDYKWTQSALCGWLGVHFSHLKNLFIPKLNMYWHFKFHIQYLQCFCLKLKGLQNVLPLSVTRRDADFHLLVKESQTKLFLRLSLSFKNNKNLKENCHEIFLVYFWLVFQPCSLILNVSLFSSQI